MTPREIYACFRGFNMYSKREAKRFAILAWSTAAFHRQKRLKPLVQILNRIDPPKPMNPGEMRRALISTFTRLGAKVNYRKKGDAKPPED
ncbi:MAG: hypothetical protein CMB99_16515 [Flavobacteriaceae bacterium]|jgi:aspartyl/asparaginyl beta-hydroxylase (cupin superfamily)|nr:hypothetical protein [Flavobacteriaceae bacterium]|tara:strand:+ start:216 stop:485 length:270 start_codon:yes stop_codon:yes gene_type:complete